MPTASISPSKFVRRLTDPGMMINGYPFPVSMARYLCPNESDGGNAKAMVLAGALPKLIAGTGDAGLLKSLQTSQEYDQIFNGHGKPEHVRTVMEIIWRNKDAVKADKRFTKYFFNKMDVANPLEAMVDDDLFGWDCIGFFGRYLEAAGVFNKYISAYPRQWLETFVPIQRPVEMEEVCAVVWANGTHIGIIDSFDEGNWSANPPHAVVTLCQCTNGEAHGPQINKGVKLVKMSQATTLDIAKYNVELAKKDESGKVAEARLSNKEKADLRASLQASMNTGYRGGIFFDVQLGDPVPPVKGTVYVAKMPNLTPGYMLE